MNTNYISLFRFSLIDIEKRKNVHVVFDPVSKYFSRSSVSTNGNWLAYRSEYKYTKTYVDCYLIYSIDLALINMLLFKWLKGSEKKSYEIKNPPKNINDDEERQQRDVDGREENRTEEDEPRRMDGMRIVYVTFGLPKQNVIDILKPLDKDTQVR